MDIDTVSARLNYQLADAQPLLILTDTVWERVKGGTYCELNPPPTARARNPAYVIYTSGSTGQPKGVQIEHGGMLNDLCDEIGALGLNAQDAVAQTAAIGLTSRYGRRWRCCWSVDEWRSWMSE